MMTTRRFHTVLTSMALAVAVTTVPAYAHRASSVAERHAGRAHNEQKGRDKDGRKTRDDRAGRGGKPQGGGREMARPRNDRDGAWRTQRDAWRDRDHGTVIVQRYYGTRGLPPGLAKKRNLPPGLQRQLHERGHLPPGLDKHWVLLPVALERDLPALPPHHVRRIVGNDLLVIDLRASLIVSVWPGVFGR
jgi:hypothetical protein